MNMKQTRLPLGNVLLTHLDRISKGDITIFEKDMFNHMFETTLIPKNNFPITDTYVEFEDEKKEKVKNIFVKMYLAGYTKDDITIELNENERVMFIKGENKNKKHFPEAENIKKLTDNASQKRFSVRYSIPRFEIENVNMEDGVLDIKLKPTEDKSVKKIEIE